MSTSSVEALIEMDTPTADEIRLLVDVDAPTRDEIMLLVDQIEAEVIAKLPPVKLPVTHTLTPGLYIRKIFMPKGTLVTSKIHRTQHPWNISMGVVSVWTAFDGVKHFAAPSDGVTRPGTRRIIYVHEDCVWTTYHPTQYTDLDKIEEQLIEKHENKLLLAP